MMFMPMCLGRRGMHYSVSRKTGMCPSSNDLKHGRLIGFGGSGSVLFRSMPRSVDAASGVSGLSGNQILRLQKPVNTGLGGKVALGISEPHRKFAWRQLGFFQSQFHDLLAYLVGDAVPHPAGPGMAILKASFALRQRHVVRLRAFCPTQAVSAKRPCRQAFETTRKSRAKLKEQFLAGVSGSP